MSNKRCLATLVKRACCDEGSITKQNLNQIEQETKCENILEQDYRSILRNFQHAEVPVGEEWRIDMLKELLQLRWNYYFLEFDQYHKS